MPANTNYPTAGSWKTSGVWNDLYGQIDEGGLFIATNPTPGTAIATTTSVVDAGNSGATSAQTRPVMIVYNPGVAGDVNARSIYPRYLSMMISQVPTLATTWEMAMWLEPIGASAWTSGGSTITPVKANPQGTFNSGAKIYFGALTAAATTSGAALVSRKRVNPAIPVTLDEWVFNFGSLEACTNVLSGGASAKRITIPCPPLCIPPSYALKMGMWGAANAAAPSWEFEFLYSERFAGL